MLLTPSMHTRRVGIALGGEQSVEVIGILEAKAPHRRAASLGDLAPVVDGLVRAGVQEDGPRGGQQRDHRHVDVGDRRQYERVLGAEQRRQPLLDLLVQHRAAKQTRPARVRAPAVEECRDPVDDLAVEVEPEVVARREVGEPPVAHTDHPPVDLVDNGIHHRMRRLQRRQVTDRRKPMLEPRAAGSPVAPWHEDSSRPPDPSYS